MKTIYLCYGKTVFKHIDLYVGSNHINYFFYKHFNLYKVLQLNIYSMHRCVSKIKDKF